MTGISLPSPADASATRHAAASPAASPRAGLAAELAVFAALAVLAVGHWSRLLVDPPGARLAAVVAVAVAAAAALGLLGISGRRGPAVWALGAAIVAGALAAGMTLVGWQLALLAPGRWDELLDKLSLGLAGVEDVNIPYGGRDEWLRLTVLAGVPLGLVAAAAFAFWPARRRQPGRIAGLVCVVALYTTAVTLDSPGAELLWGIPLLLCVAAWLWIPALPGRRALVALATVAGAGVLALPLAARLAPEDAWWDYESWDWFGRDREISFRWDHTYGPLEWPREGTTLFGVRAKEPMYWKASVLDRFDGFVWERANAADPLAEAERLARQRSPGLELPELNRQWLAQASFEIEALESEVVLGAGIPLVMQGGAEASRSRDGTITLAGDEPLSGGDGYSIVAYVPRPTSAELRSAPATYPRRRFADQVLVSLPATATQIGAAEPGLEPDAPALARQEAMRMPLWGDRDPDVDAALAASPYAGMYELARELTADADHPYEATLAIENYLKATFDYTPNVDQATYPLAAFLERDRAGYCQQFSGAMALMLRMVGIPARVVSGFAPGSYDSEEDIYEVRDTDAHAWVEVYFRGIGWVTFDPTPAGAPAARGETAEPTGFRGRSAVDEQPIGRAQSIEAALEGGTLPEDVGEDSGPSGWIALGVGVVVLVLGGVVTFVSARRRRALARGELVRSQVSELRAALARLGWSVAPRETLLQLEERFVGASRAPIAAYARRLREHLYATDAPPPPGPAERRALRRALGRGGAMRRLRALRALPPGGPGGGS